VRYLQSPAVSDAVPGSLSTVVISTPPPGPTKARLPASKTDRSGSAFSSGPVSVIVDLDEQIHKSVQNAERSLPPTPADIPADSDEVMEVLHLSHEPTTVNSCEYD
jgi:hypothetical protein